MAERQKKTFGVFAVLMTLLLLAAIGFGIMMLVGPRDVVTHGDTPVGRTAEQGALDTLQGQHLELVDYSFDEGTRQVSGSVMNASDQPYVNVQVEFVYLDLEGDSAGVIRDTTRELAARESWRFSIPLDGEQEVSDVLPGRVQGAQRDVESEDVIRDRQTRTRQPIDGAADQEQQEQSLNE